MSDKNIAERVFAADIELAVASEAAGDAILAAMGCDPGDTKTWPAFNDFGFDYYDGSFEMYGIEDLTLTLTPEQQADIAALGFQHGWFNYVDGTARHFYQKDGGFTSGPSYHHGPTVADHEYEHLKKGRQARERVKLAVEACRDVDGLSDGACRFAVLSILAPQELSAEELAHVTEVARRLAAEMEAEGA